MKKIVASILITIIFLITSVQYVYAVPTVGTDPSGSTSGSTSDDGSWVQNAFSAAKNFLTQSEVNDDLGISPMFNFIKSLIKAVNVILMVVLIGLSIIALSVTGVRYIASGASPSQKEIAKQSLHTICIGMAIGFGAYVIWRIAMSIVEIIISSLA